jgi:glycine cleavage system H lipoate-binding protein
MSCPFLRETVVESCQHSVFRKMIMRNPENAGLEKCSSMRYTECPAYRQEPQKDWEGVCCPYLQESLAQYCEAAAVTKFIPYSEAVLSRCGNDGYRYCDLYLAMAHPGEPSQPLAEGIAVPPWLYYSANHMWLDPGEDGLWHIGIDGLLARVLGTVDRLRFLTLGGTQRPAVVLTVNGVDLQMVFPNALLITGTNIYLRANPEKLTSDPYRLGWLFEGRPVGGVESECHLYEGLLKGSEAAPWMLREVDGVTRFVHEQLARPLAGETVLADGGAFAAGVAHALEHDPAQELFHQFFAPYASWMR